MDHRIESARLFIAALSVADDASLRALAKVLTKDVTTPWEARGRAEVIASIEPTPLFSSGMWSAPVVDGDSVVVRCRVASPSRYKEAVCTLHFRDGRISVVDMHFEKGRLTPRTRAGRGQPERDPLPHRTHPEVEALYGALDAQRTARGLTWQQVTHEINNLFHDTTGRRHPISTSTILSMRFRRALNLNGILQMMIWLDRSPESFVTGNTSKRAERLPRVGPERILRFDAAALYEALDRQRMERGLTWTQLAKEVGGFAAPGLTRLRNGGLLAYPDVMRLTAWVGKPVTAFTYPSEW